MTEQTKTTARRFFAVYSPRGFANEVRVQECDTAALAKELDAGFRQGARAGYIRNFRRMQALGVTHEGGYTFED